MNIIAVCIRKIEIKYVLLYFLNMSYIHTAKTHLTTVYQKYAFLAYISMETVIHHFQESPSTCCNKHSFVLPVPGH